MRILQTEDSQEKKKKEYFVGIFKLLDPPWVPWWLIHFVFPETQVWIANDEAPAITEDVGATPLLSACLSLHTLEQTSNSSPCYMGLGVKSRKSGLNTAWGWGDAPAGGVVSTGKDCTPVPHSLLPWVTLTRLGADTPKASLHLDLVQESRLIFIPFDI